MLYAISKQKRQDSEIVGIESRLLANRLSLLQVFLRLGIVPHVEARHGHSIIARKEQLRLIGFFGDRQCLLIVVDRSPRLTVTVIDLAEHYQGYHQMIAQSELAIELHRFLGRCESVNLAASGKGAIGSSEVGVESRLEAQISDPLGNGKAFERVFDGASRVQPAVQDAEIRVATARCVKKIIGLGDFDTAFDARDGIAQASHARQCDPHGIVGVGDHCGNLLSPLLRALRWGYLSTSELNIGAILSENPDALFQSGAIPQTQRQTQEWAAQFLMGATYAEVAATAGEGFTPQAVEQRLRRFFGGSPAARRDAFRQSDLPEGELLALFGVAQP